MASARQAASVSIYQLKVTLKEIRPQIWRRFLVPENITLHRLHLVLQVVMGWANYHLYRFKIGEVEFGEPHPDNEFYELKFRDSRRARLHRVARVPKASFNYEYDFGDSWEHRILVEKIMPPRPDIECPLCLDGKRACPPEDSGGPWEYPRLLRIVRNPDHEEHPSMMEWLGGRFDPEAFNLQQINGSLSVFWFGR